MCAKEEASPPQGIARPLRVRVEQALQTATAAVTAYQLLNMVEFYAGTIRPLVCPLDPPLIVVCLNDGSPLFTVEIGASCFAQEEDTSQVPDGATFQAAFDSLAEAARSSFFNRLKEASDRLLASPPPYTHDLSPPKLFGEATRQLSALLKAYKVCVCMCVCPLD